MEEDEREQQQKKKQKNHNNNNNNHDDDNGNGINEEHINNNNNNKINITELPFLPKRNSANRKKQGHKEEFDKPAESSMDTTSSLVHQPSYTSTMLSTMRPTHPPCCPPCVLQLHHSALYQPGCCSSKPHVFTSI